MNSVTAALGAVILPLLQLMPLAGCLYHRNRADGNINSSMVVSCIVVNRDYGHIKFAIIAIRFHHQSVLVPCMPKIVSVTVSCVQEGNLGPLAWTVGDQGVRVLIPPN